VLFNCLAKGISAGGLIYKDIVTKKTDYTLDLRDVIAPFTLLKVTQALREMKTGERLEILATDHDTRKYLFQVLDATGHYRMVGIDDRNDFCRIHLEKRGMTPSKPIQFTKNH
jgi:TusA-related sulfurtransferase